MSFPSCQIQHFMKVSTLKYFDRKLRNKNQEKMYIEEEGIDRIRSGREANNPSDYIWEPL